MKKFLSLFVVLAMAFSLSGSVASAAGATGPVISNVSIKSNSAKGPMLATLGDIITLTFTTDEPVTKLSSFKINSSNPDTFTNIGNNYTATHLVDSGDPITGVPATFQINVKNTLGIFSQTIEMTNDGSSVTIVDQKPVISNVSIKSNNTNPAVAYNGNIITLTFTTDEPVTKLSNFKINSSNPDTFTNVGNNYTATHLVDSGDPITGLPVTFQINVKNSAGIFSQTIEMTNDGSSVTIIAAPILTSVKITPAIATIGVKEKGDDKSKKYDDKNGKGDDKNGNVGNTVQLTAKDFDQLGGVFLGATTTFSSSNPKVATVDSTTGLVTGVSAGTATITATSVSGTITVTGTSVITVVTGDNNGKKDDGDNGEKGKGDQSDKDSKMGNH